MLRPKMTPIQTALQMLDSEEESAVLPILARLVEFALADDDNIVELNNRKFLRILMKHDLFVCENVEIRRCALYLLSVCVIPMDMLTDLTADLAIEIANMCMQACVEEVDKFCIGCLGITIEMYLSNPKVANFIVDQSDALKKFFKVISKLVIPKSFQPLQKMLQILDVVRMKTLTSHKRFPVDQIIFELNSEFLENRTIALKVMKELILDVGDDTPFADRNRCILTLRTLTEIFCKHAQDESGLEAVAVLIKAMRNEKMTKLFFEEHFFEEIVENLDANSFNYSPALTCNALAIFAENAKFQHYLQQLDDAGVTDSFIEFMAYADINIPPTHILLGLNRMMKFHEAEFKIVKPKPYPIVRKLLHIMAIWSAQIETLEEAAELLKNMLVADCHQIVAHLKELDASVFLGEILQIGLYKFSLDFILNVQYIVEKLYQHDEYDC